MNALSVGIWGVLHVIIMIATSKTTGFSFINTPSCEFGSRYEPFLSNMEIDCRTTDPKSNSTLYLKDRPAIVKSSNGSVYLVYITIKSHGKFKCVAQNQQGQKITWECQILPMPYSRIPRPVIDGPSVYPAGYSFNLTCRVTQVGIIKLEFYKITGSGYIKLPNNRLISNDRSLKLLFITPSVMPKTRYVCKATSRMAAKETDKVISIKNPVQVQIVSFPQGKYLALQPSKRKDIPCRAIGFPRPTLKWFKNGKRILTNMFTCEKGENVKCLAIRSPTYPKDEGNYTCQATNDFNSSRKSIVAAFQFPPKIDDTIKEVVVEGIKAKDLSCKIIKKRGQILPTYFKWLQSLPCISQKQCKAQSKNWQPISANHDQRPPSNISTFNSTITVPTSALNTRYYKCIASNTLGNDSHVIAFYRSKAYKPEVEIKGVDTFDAEKTIQLSCVISVGNFTRWSKNGRKITQNSRNPRVLISRRTVKDINEIVTLTIVNATVDDTGRYRCKGKGYDGSRLSDVKMVTVKAVFKPNITSLSNITVNHYSNNQTNIEITCHVTANPKPLITWRNNKGSTLTSLIKRKNCENTVRGYYLKSTSKETGNVLLICDADNRYTGLYTCHAQNYKGYDVKTAYVDILTSPKIISDSKYKIVNKDIGQSVDKDCNATGNPSPTVMWTKLSPNGTTVLRGGKKETFSKLNIPKLREDDYGNYTCIASNSRGTDRMVVSIRGLAILNKQKGPDVETIIIASGIGGVLGLLFLIAVLACCFVNHRQKRLLEEYKAIRYLRSGEDYKLDPNRTILEQCEELPYDADWEFPVKRLILQGVIGSGAFGQVMKAEAVGILSFSARDKTSDAFKRRSRLRRRLSSSRIYQDSAGNDYTRTSVAVKMLKAEANESDYKDLATELKIMIHLGEHSNIINLLGACTRTKQLMVIMEFAPHGNLLNFLRSRREIYEATWRKTANNPDAEFTLADLVMYSYQIARGMDFLSSKKCVHRDLAARNVLIGEDYVMKIADFGLARDIYKSDLYVKETTGLLPVKWMAPESLFDRVYTQKTDVWSFGVVLWETQTLGGTPYPGIPVEELMDYLAEGKRMRQPVDCPPEIYAIMRDCWLHKPSERPTFSELVRRIERIIEKKISGQEAEDAYISVFMDEDLHRIYYLEPKEALKDSSLANSSRNNEPNSMTEEEIQASPLPPVPCLSLENLYKSDGNENDANYCNPIDNNPETRYVQSPLSPKRSPNSKDQGNIFNYYQNSPVSSLPRGTDYSEKRMSESSTGVESGIDMDESYQSNDYSLGRRKRHYGLTQPVYAEGISLLDSSVVKDKTKETFL